jgi:hypothetical protein
VRQEQLDKYYQREEEVGNMLGLTVCMPGGGHYGQLPSVLWIQ